MKLTSIRIVLVATTHPGNIGSAARAMKTMGLSRLYLISPKCCYPHRQADELAAGADDILQNAVISNSLTEALSDCQLVIATSARAREMDLPLLTPSSAAQLIQSTPSDVEIAIVFGREHAGLTNDELLNCNYHLHIPSNPEFSSLNLAQAVQIVSYELRMQSMQNEIIETKQSPSLARMGDVEQFYDHLQELLVDIDFLKPSNPKKLMQRLRRLFNRAKLEQTEVNILRGIVSHVLQSLNSKS